MGALFRLIVPLLHLAPSCMYMCNNARLHAEEKRPRNHKLLSNERAVPADEDVEGEEGAESQEGSDREESQGTSPEKSGEEDEDDDEMPDAGAIEEESSEEDEELKSRADKDEGGDDGPNQVWGGRIILTTIVLQRSSQEARCTGQAHSRNRPLKRKGERGSRKGGDEVDDIFDSDAARRRPKYMRRTSEPGTGGRGVKWQVNRDDKKPDMTREG